MRRSPGLLGTGFCGTWYWFKRYLVPVYSVLGPGSLCTRSWFSHSFILSFILETYMAPLQDTTSQRLSQASHGQRRTCGRPGVLVHCPGSHSTWSCFSLYLVLVFLFLNCAV